MSTNVSLALTRFNIDTTDDRRTIVIIGKRNSGKSQMTADWLCHKRAIPVGIVMSSTEEATGFFKTTCGVPDTFIYHEWEPDVIDKVISKQRALAKAGTPRNCFIVLDDLAFDKAIFNSKQMREMMFNGRHYGIMLIITAQFLGDLPTYFRSNIDYVIAYRTPGIQDRERLWKNFFGVIPTFPMFCGIMDKCTENYECIILDNTVQSNKLSDCIYWYKAPLRTSTSNTFRIGCSTFHKFHSLKGRAAKEEEEKRQADAAAAEQSFVPRNPRHPNVTVRKLGPSRTK